MDFLNKTLDWISQTNSYDRIGFVKCLFDCLGNEELKVVNSVLTRAKSKSKCKGVSWVGPTIAEAKEGGYKFKLPVEGIVPQILEKPEADAVTIPVNTVTTPAEASGGKGQHASGIFGTKIIPPKQDIRNRWWRKLDRKTFISFDVENVNLIGVTGMQREKAAIVGMVDYSYQPIYDVKVFQQPHTFETYGIGARVSGITNPYMLQGGIPEEQLKKDMLKLTDGKFAVMCGATKDFRLVGLPYAQYSDKIFDLQTFYRRPKEGVPNGQPMSLRDIYFYHFQEDCQPPGKSHTAINDATSTMKIFMQGYCKDRGEHHDFMDEDGVFNPDFSLVPRLKDMEAKGLKFCKF